MLQSYVSTLKKWKDFNGRATRKEYFTFLLINFLFSFIFSFVVAILLIVVVGGIASAFSIQNSDFEARFIAVIVMVGLIIFVLPSIALGVRRLHDRNMSGWWYLITFVPSVGGLIFFILTLLPSVNEGNRYGELQTEGASNPSVNTPLAHDEEMVAVVEEDAPQVSAQVPAEVKA